jgi:hypothetical protein
MSAPETPDAVLEQDDIEVQQKSDAVGGKLEVGEQLGLMQTVQCFDRFDFDDDCFFDNHVEPVSSIDLDPIVNNREKFLPAGFDTPC